jgi:hypothetical protein
MNNVVIQLPESTAGQAAVGGFRMLAVGLLVPIGLIHLNLAPAYGIGAAYIGFLFYATFYATLVAAVGIAVGVRGSWILGLLASAGALGGLVTAATVGLPNFTESFHAPKAMLSIVLEASFVVLFAAAAAIRPAAVFAKRTRPRAG